MNIIDEVIFRHLGIKPVRREVDCLIQKDLEQARAGKTLMERKELFQEYARLTNKNRAVQKVAA